MRCGEARRWGLAEAQGQLSADHRRLLRDHLACCPDCAERTRQEGWIERDLVSLRDLPGLDIDVSWRVRQALAQAGPPASERPSGRQLGWAGVAAAALAALALVELAALLTGRGDAVSQVRTLVRALGSVGASLLRPLVAVTQAGFDATVSLLQQALELGVASGAVQAAGWSIVAGWLLLLSTTGLFVGRDLMRGRRLDSREEIPR